MLNRVTTIGQTIFERTIFNHKMGSKLIIYIKTLINNQSDNKQQKMY